MTEENEENPEEEPGNRSCLSKLMVRPSRHGREVPSKHPYGPNSELQRMKLQEKLRNLNLSSLVSPSSYNLHFRLF